MPRKRLAPQPADSLLSADNRRLAAHYRRDNLLAIENDALDEYTSLLRAHFRRPIPLGYVIGPEIEPAVHALVQRIYPTIAKRDWERMPYSDRLPYLKQALAAVKAPAATDTPPKSDEPPRPPMSDLERDIFTYIRDNSPVSGKEIATHLGRTEKSLDRPLRQLKKHFGVKNRRGVGYYHESSQTAGMTQE